mgnify:CR=1 FL=1
MASYNICGRECNFYSIPHGILSNYKPTPRTHILAWRCKNETLNLTIIMLLNSAYVLGAIERPPFLVEDGERMVYLLEHPHPTVFDPIEKFVGWSCGTNCMYRCPYTYEKAKYICEGYRDWEDLIFTKTKMGTRPLLNNPNPKLPPIPDLYDQEHQPLKIAGN